MGKERRRHTRMKGIPIAVRAPELERLSGSQPWVEDLSEGGILLLSKDAPEVGKTLSVELCAAQWKAPLKVRATVVRVFEPERTDPPITFAHAARPKFSIALAFDALGAAEVKRLAEFITWYGGKPTEPAPPRAPKPAEAQMTAPGTPLVEILQTELAKTKNQLQGALMDLQAAREEIRARRLEIVDLRQRLAAAERGH